MPYIKLEDRNYIETPLMALIHRLNKKPGNYAYVIFRLLQEYTYRCELSYKTCATAIGILSTVKHEFTRRVIDPYEDEKKDENGDVF